MHTSFCSWNDDNDCSPCKQVHGALTGPINRHVYTDMYACAYTYIHIHTHVGLRTYQDHLEICLRYNIPEYMYIYYICVNIYRYIYVYTCLYFICTFADCYSCIRNVGP